MPTNETTAAYDPSLGKTSLARLEATLRALPADEVIAPNSDPEAGALAALALVEVARLPEPARRFALLPAEVLDPATVGRLEQTAWALWYAHVESRTAAVTQSTVKVSAELIHDAQELKARLQKLLEYHLGDEPQLALELADIRLGTGYGDLASDLQRYARLSEDHHARVSGDPKLFRRGDVKLARRLAGEILVELRGSLADRASTSDLRNRAWTLLSRDHAEVVATGTFLFRHEPEMARRFVSLRAAIVPHRARRKTGGDPDAGGGAPDAGGSDPDAGGSAPPAPAT